MTTRIAASHSKLSEPPANTFAEQIPPQSSDQALVDELCHLLARVLIRMNAEQQTETARGGVQ